MFSLLKLCFFATDWKENYRLQDDFILQCPDYSLKEIERTVFHPDTLSLMALFLLVKNNDI